MSQHSKEIEKGDRFSFGENWSRFLTVLDDKRVEVSKNALQQMLAADSLVGKNFVDIGSGSGLSSLAARLLGARVHLFDYNPQSVACTLELRRRYFPDDPEWIIGEGSVLDQRLYREIRGIRCRVFLGCSSSYWLNVASA